ncbi:MAG: hypothetical protein PHQ62_03605 [Clostridia bacterium]|nr:hypothetical protein [Clostridia bacterium]
MAEIYQFVYPVIFVKGEDQVVATFPDLGITTDGFSFEEAFLFAKDYLRVYCTYAKKYEIDINQPSFFEDVANKNIMSNVMLIDTVLFPIDLK